MDMFKESRKSQILFVLGLTILVSSVAFSVYAVFRLEQAYFERLAAVEEEEFYDSISQKVKDWALITHMRVDGSRDKLVLSTEVLIAAETVVNELSVKTFETHVQKELAAELVVGIRTLIKSPDNMNWETVKVVDSLLEKMIKIENARIDHHSSLVISYINKLVMAAVLSILVALFMIILSLASENRNQKARTKFIEELRNLKEEAESASLLKSKFLSTVSHEIRTPLNGIIGLSDILSSSPPSDKTKSLARTINQSGQTLLRIINDILDFSKIEAGKFTLVESEFSIVDILNQVLLTLSPKAAEKSINLNYDLDPKIPKTLVADQERLTQVLFNLVGNAIKFTKVGSVVVRVRSLEATTGKAVLKFSVEDTGIGISAADIENLFKPFVQVSQSGTSGEPGTGLGLSISQSIVRVMGGEIHVDSSLGRGSVFSFVLPLVAGSDLYLENQPTFRNAGIVKEFERVEALGHDDFKPRILVVEDNPTNQIVAQSMLAQLDVNAIIVSNGQEALDILEKNSFDLILMDCQMPVLDGFETTKILRNKNCRLPILAMTANAFGEDRQKCFDSGMDGYISKPVDISDLREELVEHLAKNRIFSKASLMKLDTAVGAESRRKVVRAFLSTLPVFRDSLRLAIQNQSLSDVKKVAHRFKSSSLTVGGVEFGHLCEELENVDSLESATSVQNRSLTALSYLENQLLDFA